MPEGYCVKCKAKKEIINAVEEVMKNGRKAIKGKCPTCGRWIHFTIRGKRHINDSEAATLPQLPANWASEAVIL